MDQENLIKRTAEELLGKMNFVGSVVEIKQQDDSRGLIVSIKVDDASQLIGQGGANLYDFQKILRILVIKQDPESPIFLVDINGYKEKREQFLRELSREIAAQVVEGKKSVMLQPMSSYERRIVHLELAGRLDLATESVGEEPERRVIIKPLL